MIATSDLRKSFVTPAGALPVLQGIDIDIAEGEMVAVVGASGVGKSTLLHVLGTLDRPSRGNVRYWGRDVFALDQRELTAFRNGTIGFVFQFHHLLPEFSAIENVMMPALISGRLSREESTERAISLLEELGVGPRRDHRPGELSGGEQQRVAVARALVMKPRVVLADEPTGNLDTATGNDLFDLLVKTNAERRVTFVMVTHNPDLAGRCHRVLEMVDGKIRPVET